MTPDTWRADPRTPYHVWARSQPPVWTLIGDVRVLTIPAIVWLIEHAGRIPVYRPDTGEATKMDATGARWKPAGERDERGYYMGGDEIPADVVARMLAWAETYVRQNAKAHLIPRAYKSYQRNTYTATRTALIAFEDLYEIENRAREAADPAVRRKA